MGAPIVGWISDTYGARIGFASGGAISVIAAWPSARLAALLVLPAALTLGVAGPALAHEGHP
ncbi:hypothetical protein ACWEQJ_21835, partial [Streptomyces cyaneofuscatus]